MKPITQYALNFGHGPQNNTYTRGDGHGFAFDQALGVGLGDGEVGEGG